MSIKKITINGIDCAHCASKVESKVSEISGLNNVSFNFISKILSFELTEDVSFKEKLDEVKKIISSVEPDAEIIEENFSKIKNQVFILTNPATENSINYIEKKCLEIQGVISVKGDYKSGSFSFEIDTASNENEVTEKIKSTINNITGYEVSIKTTAPNIIKNSYFKLFTFNFSIGILLFAFGFIPYFKNFSLYIFLCSYILIGWDIVYEAFKKIFKGNFFDENFLMTIATFGAFAIGEYSEAVGVLLFYKVGEFFQDSAVDKSKLSINSLLKLKAESALLSVSDTEVKSIPVESIEQDMILIVKPGSVIPADGIIINGNSNFDTSNLTGESLPKYLKEGDCVLSGYINGKNVIKIKSTSNYANSTISKILELVQNAAGKKSVTENFITKFAKYYTPAVVCLSLFTAFVIPFALNDSFSKWIYRSLIFLVVSCPCALVISIPLAFFTAVGRAAKAGILVKGSCYLESLNSLKTLVLDKTGTLTEGNFKVSNIVPADNFKKEDVLQTAAYAEYYSSHPIAVSILNEFNFDIDINSIKEYSEISGYGVITKVNNDIIVAGNEKLLKRENIDFSSPDNTETSVLIAKNGVYIGRIDISDRLKKDSKATISTLNSLGISTVMLTGDNLNSAQKSANEAGIREFYSNLLPHEKVEIFEKIQSRNKDGKTAFIGDGINDSPVIARADIGFSMGIKGADSSIEASDIVLMTDEISKVVTAIKIAKATRKVIIQNIFFSLSVKIAVLILGIAGISNMWEAVFADVGVALIAILNSMRLIKKIK